MTEPYLSPLRPMVTHIAVVVDDIEAGIEWYHNVLGAELIWGPHTWGTSPDDPAATRAAREILDEKFQSMRLCHLRFSNFGLELFEFIEPRTEFSRFEDRYSSSGAVNHFGIYVDDVARFARFVAENGGRQRSAPLEFPAPGCLLVYCQDPWGNPFELYNRDHESFYLNREAPGSELRRPLNLKRQRE